MTSYLFFVIINIRIEIIAVGGVLMEQKMIHKTSEQCIFYIKDNNLDFYLIIPNSKQVSIVLGIFSDVNEEMIKKLSNESDKYPYNVSIIDKTPPHIIADEKEFSLKPPVKKNSTFLIL